LPAQRLTAAPETCFPRPGCPASGGKAGDLAAEIKVFAHGSYTQVSEVNGPGVR